MKSLKLVTVAALLLAASSANALTAPAFLRNAYNGVSKRVATFKKNHDMRYWYGGAAVVTGAAGYGLYRYNDTVRNFVDKTVSKGKAQAQSIARDPKKRAIAIGVGGTVAALVAAWKLGWLKKLSGSISSAKSSKSGSNIFGKVKIKQRSRK